MFASTRGLAYGLACLILVAACGGGGDGGDDGPDPTIPVTTTNYTVIFNTEQVIAGPADDSLTATASLFTARGDGTTAGGSVTVSGASANTVTVNLGYAGENGPVAITLQNSGGGTWSIPSNTELDDAEFFRLGATGYYVSVRTPVGELRGQILPPGWALGVFELDDSRVVPAASSSGAAQAGLTVNPMTGQTSARITVAGINNVTSAGIRDAIAGARGDVLISLEQDAANPTVWGTIDINNPNAGNVLGSAGIERLLNGRLYFGVETVTNPDGELRAQILSDESAVFDVALTDDAVVTSGAPVTSNSTGSATVTWTASTRRLAVAVNTDAAAVTSASVHTGAAGTIGPIISTLAPDVTLPGNWYSTVVELTDAETAAFQAGDTYINVTTITNPEGELRGQIVEPAP